MFGSCQIQLTLGASEGLSRLTVITQSAALCLLSHTQTTESLKASRSVGELPGNESSHGGIFKDANLRKLLNILPSEHSNHPQCENVNPGGRQREGA